jgi:hypothetical protein
MMAAQGWDLLAAVETLFDSEILLRRRDWVEYLVRRLFWASCAPKPARPTSGITAFPTA